MIVVFIIKHYNEYDLPFFNVKTCSNRGLPQFKYLMPAFLIYDSQCNSNSQATRHPASQCSPTQAISWQKKEKIRCTTPSTQTKQLLRNISKKLWTLIISSFHHLCLLFWGPFNFLHDLDITLRYDDTTLRCNNLATLVLTKNI